MFSSSTMDMAEQWVLRVLLSQYRVGYLGRYDSGGGVTYYVPGKPGYVYVRLWNGDITSLDICVNTVAPLDPSNRVFLRRINGVLRVEFSDPVTAANLYGQNVGAAGVPPHVQPLGNDPVTSDRFLPGQVGISPLGGMNVRIQGFIHERGVFPTTDIDLTSYVTPTSGDSNWAYVYVDPVTNTASAVAGSDQLPPPQYLSPSLLESIPLPAGVIPLAGVALTNGQTVIVDPSLIVDRRAWINSIGALLTGDSEAQTIAAGAITTGNKSVIVVSPTATLSTINLVGAPRLLWLIGDTGVTVTLATGGNISSAAVVTDTESVLVYHDGMTAFVLAGGSGGDATTVTYTPTTPADWPSVPTDVQEALDTLAADAVTGGINKDLYTQTTNVTVANTTTPTTLLGAGQGSSLLPANYFVAGRTLVLDFAGVRSSALVAPNITFEIDLGSTTICATATFADVSGLSGQQVHGHVEITCLTTGGSGAVNAQGWVELNSTGTVAVRAEMVASNPVTVDTTIAQQIKVLLTWGTASASNTLTNTNAKAQTVDPNAGSSAGGGGLGTVLWDTTLASAGTFDTNSTDDHGNSGAFGTGYLWFDILFDLRAAAAVTGVVVRMTMNNDTTDAHYQAQGSFFGSVAVTNGAQGSLVNNSRNVFNAPAASATANYFGQGKTVISNPDSAHFKVAVTASADPRSSSDHNGELFSLLWRDTSAITRLALDVSNATTTFVAGSRMTVIGYK